MSWQYYPGAHFGAPEASQAAQTTRNGDNCIRVSAPPSYSTDPAQGYQDAAYRHSQANPPPPPPQDHWMQGPQRPIPAQLMPPRGEWVSLNGPWANEASVAGYRLHEDRRHWQHTGQPFLIQRSRTPGFLTATLRLLGFHVANVVFAVIGSGVLSAGICAAVSLLPMCCVGLLLFQVIVYIVFALAQWDITLSNYIAPAHQRASPNLSPHRGLMGRHEFSGHRIASGLTHFSPLSLMAMLYFVWVKPVIGLLSLLAVLLVTSPVTSFITLLLRGDINWMEIYGVDTMTLSRNRVVSLVGAIIVTLVGIALMQLVAKISRQATQFFCCENFTVTSRFHGRYPFRSIGQQHVMGSYGAVSS